MKNPIRNYQQRCYWKYLEAIGIDYPYIFPEGNSIRPLPPVQTAIGGLMVIGAYPSARFEKRKNSKNRYRIIPVGNNLHPFAKEIYFDGVSTRVLESGDRIREYLFDPLGIDPEECWITDLVKVFLYKKDHKDSVNDIFPNFEVPVLRNRFEEFGGKSLDWIMEEIQLCKPKIILTLGEEVARVVSGKKMSASKLLTTQLNNPEKLGNKPTMLLPHPDGCRRSEKWRNILKDQVKVIKRFLKKHSS